MIDSRDQLEELKNRGALFVINHSGGKDSQAMTIELRKFVPDEQILVVHSDLIGADWPGCWDHIKETCDGLEIRKCVAVDWYGNEKSFMDMVDNRKMWPSPTTRNCTSDLKRGPIEKLVRHYIAEKNLSGLVVNCMGIRAEESVMRTKGVFPAKNFKKNGGVAVTLDKDNRNSKNGREYYQAYPIFSMKLDEVWKCIESANQKPHEVYSKGMSRLSCMFCIMASKQDLTIAARLVPDVYKKYCEKEREIDFTFAMPVKGEKKFLPEITGIDPDNNPGANDLEIPDDYGKYDDFDCGGTTEDD